MTEPTRTVLDLGDVILRVRGIEVVDDNGDVRSRIAAKTGGPVELIAIHPFDPDVIAVVGAGLDTEDDENSCASIYLTDGAASSVDVGPDGVRQFRSAWRVA